MSTVILAEKPSQALAYASALKQSNKKCPKCGNNIRTI
jgi:DNA topoisomerase-3